MDVIDVWVAMFDEGEIWKNGRASSLLKGSRTVNPQLVLRRAQDMSATSRTDCRRVTSHVARCKPPGSSFTRPHGQDKWGLAITTASVGLRFFREHAWSSQHDLRGLWTLEFMIWLIC